MKGAVTVAGGKSAAQDHPHGNHKH
jgi:hypothetical protein